MSFVTASAAYKTITSSLYTWTALAGMTNRTIGTWNWLCFVWSVKFEVSSYQLQRKGLFACKNYFKFLLIIFGKFSIFFYWRLFLTHLMLCLWLLVSDICHFLSQKWWIESSLYKEYCHRQVAVSQPMFRDLSTCNHENLKCYFFWCFFVFDVFSTVHHSIELFH